MAFPTFWLVGVFFGLFACEFWENALRYSLTPFFNLENPRDSLDPSFLLRFLLHF